MRGDVPVPSVPGERVGERHFHSQRAWEHLRSRHIHSLIPFLRLLSQLELGTLIHLSTNATKIVRVTLSLFHFLALRIAKSKISTTSMATRFAQCATVDVGASKLLVVLWCMMPRGAANLEVPPQGTCLSEHDPTIVSHGCWSTSRT